MTIVIALKDQKNKRIIIGADKQSTYGQCIIKSPGKIISLPLNIIDGYGTVINNAKIHIAITGSAFMKHFFEYGFTVPEMDNQQNFMEYLYQSFLPEVRKKLTNNQLVEINNSELDSDSVFIVVFKENVYRVGRNFSVCEFDEEYGIEGSGYEVALGSLYTNLTFHHNMNRIEMVKQAIRAAGANTIYCDEDVDLKIINYK